MQPRQFFSAADGSRLAYVDAGHGPLVILVHGFLSNADINWFYSGIAGRLLDAGFRVTALDLRAHGQSAAPADAAGAPPDILPADVEALVRHLDTPAYDLVGYSLGARTAARLAVRRQVPLPRRMVLGGMGLEGMTDTRDRQDWFANTIEQAGSPDLDPAQHAVARFLRAGGADPAGAVRVLRSQVDSDPADLARIALPVLVLAGDKDLDNGSLGALAALLPLGREATTPGTHMTAVGEPAFGQAIVDFLQA